MKCTCLKRFCMCDMTHFCRTVRQFTVIERLGKGGFGVVNRVLSKEDGREFALKRIKLPGDKMAQEKVMWEVQALAQLSHPGIVCYFDSWRETGGNGMEEWTSSQSTSRSSPFSAHNLPTAVKPTDSRRY